RLDHVADAALVLDDVRRLFLRGFLGGVHRAALGHRAGDARIGTAGHGHQQRAPAGHWKVPLRIHGVLGLYLLLAVLPHVVRQHAGRDDLLQGADGRVLADDLAPAPVWALRRSVLLPDGTERQAEWGDAGRRRSVAPPDALRGPVLASHADPASR